MVEPRIRLEPAGDSALGDEAVGLAASAGLVLDDWQADVLRASLRRLGDGRWAAFEIGVMLSRQNGKGAIYECRELAGIVLLGEKLLIHSAHEYATSLEAFCRMVWLLDEDTELKRSESAAPGTRTASRGSTSRTGPVCGYRTRTSGGGRGFSRDCMGLDEAMHASRDRGRGAVADDVGRENPQVWFAGCAVDQEVHEHGVMLARLRERGYSGAEPSLAYFEWSLRSRPPGLGVARGGGRPCLVEVVEPGAR